MNFLVNFLILIITLFSYTSEACYAQVSKDTLILKDQVNRLQEDLEEQKTITSTLLKRINEDPNDKTRISYEFSRWNKEEDPKTKKLKPSKGLAARRKKETDLYFS